jgi:hypothetical protein
MYFSKKHISILIFTFILSSCMSEQIANIKHVDVSVSKQALNSTQAPHQVCESASMAIARANKESLYFFAPLHLEQASQSLENGLEQIKGKESVMDGVRSCFKTTKLIKNGMAIKVKVKSSLDDVLKELAMLKKIDREKAFADDIQDYVDDVIDLVKIIETGQMNEAMQDQAELLKEMLDLEVEIVTQKHLAPVVSMLEKAESIKAADLAEKTFKKAEIELENARKYIRFNYRNDKQVEITSSLAMRAAKHAFYIAKEVEVFKEMKPEVAEQKVLFVESLLERVNKKFKKNIVIGHSLYEQGDIVSARLESLLDEMDSLKRKIAELKRQSEVVVKKMPAEEPVELMSLLDKKELETENIQLESEEVEVEQKDVKKPETALIINESTGGSVEEIPRSVAVKEKEVEN